MGVDGPAKAGMSFLLERAEERAEVVIVRLWIDRVEYSNPLLCDCC